MVDFHDTIFALATPPGVGSIAIIRISGPAAGDALGTVSNAVLPVPRRASLRTLQDPQNGEVIDHALVLWFPAPASFSGEDIVELHMHGGRAVVSAMLSVLAGISGLRPAEPGEFSRRAFLNGRLDLTAAEGLADLVAADTTAQRRQALQQMDGALGKLYESWRERLVLLRAHLEAEIDFPDEDLPQDIEIRMRKAVLELAAVIRAHLEDGHRGERIRDGIHIVLLGPPNVGKSSLLNRLAGRDVAIVSATAGTTRDVIEVCMDLGGYPIVLSDTAGIRTVADSLEKEGVRRALGEAATADLKLIVMDGRNWPTLDDKTKALIDPDSVLVLNKADLLTTERADGEMKFNDKKIVCVSALHGTGLSELEQRLKEELHRRWGALETHHRGNLPIITRVRHRTALKNCLAALERIPKAPWPELAAEDLRLAARDIGQISGHITVDEVLDVVFRDFCLGK